MRKHSSFFIKYIFLFMLSLVMLCAIIKPQYSNPEKASTFFSEKCENSKEPKSTNIWDSTLGNTSEVSLESTPDNISKSAPNDLMTDTPEVTLTNELEANETDTPEITPTKIEKEDPTKTPESKPTKTPENKPTKTPETKPTKKPETKKPITPAASKFINPNNYLSKTTVKVLSSSLVDITERTAEFQNLVKNCTKVAYAYADPRENANTSLNSSTSGAKSFAVYIFGYDSTTQDEFLNTKKAIPYILNKLYFDSKWHSTWYNTLVGGNGIYVILEEPGSFTGGAKFGSPADGFGVRIASGIMSTFSSKSLLYRQLGYCIWDVGELIDNMQFGTDTRTDINYGTGNFKALYSKLYEDSISKNTFYTQDVGRNSDYGNFAENTSKFFTSSWRNKLKENDPIVYKILDQIYSQY